MDRSDGGMLDPLIVSLRSKKAVLSYLSYLCTLGGNVIFKDMPHQLQLVFYVFSVSLGVFLGELATITCPIGVNKYVK